MGLSTIVRDWLLKPVTDSIKHQEEVMAAKIKDVVDILTNIDKNLDAAAPVVEAIDADIKSLLAELDAGPALDLATGIQTKFANLGARLQQIDEEVPPAAEDTGGG